MWSWWLKIFSLPVLITSASDKNAAAIDENRRAWERFDALVSSRFSELDALKPGLSTALRTITNSHLVVGSIFLDLAHTLRAREFMPYASNPKAYHRTLSSHIVVLLSAFDEKLNIIYMGRAFQSALSVVSSLTGNAPQAVANLRSALQTYNQLAEPHRTDLGEIRNTVAAHRDISAIEVRNATEKLSADFIEKLVRAAYNLSTSYNDVLSVVLTSLAQWLERHRISSSR